MSKDFIFNKIKSAKKILILPSQPADLDCLCSAISMLWYVKEHAGNTEVKVYSFFQIPDKLMLFDEFKVIEQKYLAAIDLNVYDLIIGVDGNGYDRYLTNSYQKLITHSSTSHNHHFIIAIKNYFSFN